MRRNSVLFRLKGGSGGQGLQSTALMRMGRAVSPGKSPPLQLLFDKLLAVSQTIAEVSGEVKGGARRDCLKIRGI